MPEGKEKVNEIALRRKRIFQLFKKFHPDVFSGTEHEETAGELTKALTAILELEVGEAMPPEFAGTTLPIVFLDDNGNTLRSKTPFKIPASSEDFLSALEYIVVNKKVPKAVETKTEAQSETRDSSSNSQQKTEQANQNRNSKENSVSKEAIAQIRTIADAQRVMSILIEHHKSQLISYFDFEELKDRLQARVRTLLVDTLKAKTFENINEAKNFLTEYHKIEKLKLLSYIDFLSLQDDIQEKIGSLLFNKLKIKAFENADDAKKLLTEFENANNLGVISYLGYSSLKDGVQSKMYAVLSRQLKTITLSHSADAKTLLASFEQAQAIGVLSYLDFYTLRDSLREKFKDLR